MAKRQRGARPGQRAPLQRGGRPAAPAPATRPAAPPKPASSLSDDELARAAELEARILAEEQAATSSAARGRDRRRASAITPSARPRGAAALTAVADDEYRFVMSDLRKIAVVFGMVFGLLVLSWLLIVVTGVVAV
jgi:hypothetical protein